MAPSYEIVLYAPNSDEWLRYPPEFIYKHHTGPLKGKVLVYVSLAFQSAELHLQADDFRDTPVEQNDFTHYLGRRRDDAAIDSEVDPVAYRKDWDRLRAKNLALRAGRELESRTDGEQSEELVTKDGTTVPKPYTFDNIKMISEDKAPQWWFKEMARMLEELEETNDIKQITASFGYKSEKATRSKINKIKRRAEALQKAEVSGNKSPFANEPELSSKQANEINAMMSMFQRKFTRPKQPNLHKPEKEKQKAKGVAKSREGGRKAGRNTLLDAPVRRAFLMKKTKILRANAVVLTDAESMKSFFLTADKKQKRRYKDFDEAAEEHFDSLRDEVHVGIFRTANGDKALDSYVADIIDDYLSDKSHRALFITHLRVALERAIGLLELAQSGDDNVLGISQDVLDAVTAARSTVKRKRKATKDSAGSDKRAKKQATTSMDYGLFSGRGNEDVSLSDAADLVEQSFALGSSKGVSKGRVSSHNGNQERSKSTATNKVASDTVFYSSPLYAPPGQTRNIQGGSPHTLRIAEKLWKDYEGLHAPDVLDRNALPAFQIYGEGQTVHPLASYASRMWTVGYIPPPPGSMAATGPASQHAVRSATGEAPRQPWEDAPQPSSPTSVSHDNGPPAADATDTGATSRSSGQLREGATRSHEPLADFLRRNEAHARAIRASYATRHPTRQSGDTAEKAPRSSSTAADSLRAASPATVTAASSVVEGPRSPGGNGPAHQSSPAIDAQPDPSTITSPVADEEASTPASPAPPSDEYSDSDYDETDVEREVANGFVRIRDVLFRSEERMMRQAKVSGKESKTVRFGEVVEYEYEVESEEQDESEDEEDEGWDGDDEEDEGWDESIYDE